MSTDRRCLPKLNYAVAEEIRVRHREGVSLHALAREYGVSATSVLRIVRGEAYRRQEPAAEPESTR